MIILLSFLFSTVLLLASTQWITDILTTHNLAEIGAAILGIIALFASVQLRSLFEKIQEVLQLFAQYTDPKSEEGKNLSPREKERLFDLFLHELRIVLDQFGGKMLIRIGGFIRSLLAKLIAK